MRHTKKLLLFTALTVLLFCSNRAEAQIGYPSYYGFGAPYYGSLYRGYGYSTNRYVNYSNYYSRAVFYNSSVSTKPTKTFAQRRQERVQKRACRKAARGK